MITAGWRPTPWPRWQRAPTCWTSMPVYPWRMNRASLPKPCSWSSPLPMYPSALIPPSWRPWRRGCRCTRARHWSIRLPGKTKCWSGCYPWWPDTRRPLWPFPMMKPASLKIPTCALPLPRKSLSEQRTTAFPTAMWWWIRWSCPSAPSTAPGCRSWPWCAACGTNSRSILPVVPPTSVSGCPTATVSTPPS